MKIPMDSLIRILVDGVDYKAGELARYNHEYVMYSHSDVPQGQHHSINAIRRSFTIIEEGQFEVIPGHMEYKRGDKVYISTTHSTYGQKQFEVISHLGNKSYRIKHEGLETAAQLGELIPVYIGNKHSKHVLERGE